MGLDAAAPRRSERSLAARWRPPNPTSCDGSSSKRSASTMTSRALFAWPPSLTRDG